MLNQDKIIEYAIKGINAEIEDLEKQVHQGYKYLQKYENGGQPKTKKTPYEIKEIIKNKKSEIEKLADYKNKLKWELSK